VEGIKLVGTLPAALQGYVAYVAAVSADSGAPEAALQFVEFLSDPRLRDYWTNAGFEQVGGR
jgi:ABC-type molybdate transport system substrate-binding protein